MTSDHRVPTAGETTAGNAQNRRFPSEAQRTFEPDLQPPVEDVRNALALLDCSAVASHPKSTVRTYAADDVLGIRRLLVSAIQKLSLALVFACGPLTAPPAKRCPPKDTLVVGRLPDSIRVVRGCP
jgi:hypothetical protein